MALSDGADDRKSNSGKEDATDSDGVEAILDQRAEDVATCLESIIAELSHHASTNGLGHLAYLLDIARLEAETLKSKRSMT